MQCREELFEFAAFPAHCRARRRDNNFCLAFGIGENFFIIGEFPWAMGAESFAADIDGIGSCVDDTLGRFERVYTDGERAMCGISFGNWGFFL